MTTLTLTPTTFQARMRNALDRIPNAFLILALIMASFFVSIAATVVFNAVAANAGTCTGGSGGGLSGSDGSACTGGSGGTGGSTGGGSTPAPVTQVRSEATDYVQPPFNANLFGFTVDCSLWSGAAGGGSTGWGVDGYQLSSQCRIPRGQISATAVARGGEDPAWRSGPVTYDGATLSGGTAAMDQCAPQGENSAYAKSYLRTVKETKTITKVRIVFSDGSTKEGKQTSKSTYVVNYASMNCMYPTPKTGLEKDCFYNYNGRAYYSANIGTIKNSGKLTKTRGVLAGDPRTPIWNGDPKVAPICDRTGTPDVNITQNLEENGYGYYRLNPTYSYKHYKRTDWIGGGRTFYSKWENTNTGNGSHTNWFAYSCSANKPFEGPFAYGNLPNRNANFSPASCPQVNWRCELEDSTTIGLNRSTIPAGTTKVNTPVTVMRNGETIPLTFSKLKVVDYTNGAGVNVANGGSGQGVRNVSQINYKSTVRAGSSPFYGTDVNSSSQYFKQYKTVDTRTVENWGSWLTNANTNLNKGISFNWASENGASFVAERQYRVTAEFHIPRGTTIDSNGNGGSYSYQWIKDTKDCYEYNSSGKQTTNLLTATSNPAQVVRSVGDAN